ncbi:MAG: transglutaminase domain-containing protein [Sandaracinaceae bacterium]
MRSVLPALACLALAATVRADDGPMLHEYVPEVRGDEGTSLISSGGPEPSALVYDGEVLPAPDDGLLSSQERPMMADPGDGRAVEEAGRRSPTFHPDRVTELNGTLGYYTVFTPSIAPFKRITALDRVERTIGGSPILSVAPSALAPVEVIGTSQAPPDGRPRDRFWGSVVLDFSEGRTVPFPTVAPDSRILTVRTEPHALLRFTRDGADNLFATPLGRPPGQIRVVFLMDAPRTYFGGELPSGRADALAERLTPMPAAVRREGLTVASELGLRLGMPFDETLTALVRHFRSFEESAAPPPSTGHIFLDLARGRLGVCRHRAYAFVITAQARGLRARFVQNEAHAWVEVERPSDAGWLRIDLGGAATGLEARGEPRPAYRPTVSDELPKPAAYVQAQEAARRASQDPEGPGGRIDPSLPPSAGDGPEGEPGAGPDGARGGSTPRTEAYGRRPGRIPVRLRADRRAYEVFRGRVLEVTGRATAVGEGLPGLRVEVLLRAPQGAFERLLGVTVTSEEGRYRGVFGVPPDLPVGDYDLVVRTPGSAEHAAAIAP